MDGYARLIAARRAIAVAPGQARIPALAVALTVALTVALGACSEPQRLRQLAPGAALPGPPAGLGRSTVATRGVLTYAVAFAGSDLLAAVELSTEFALVVYAVEPLTRPATRPPSRPRVHQRIELGPPVFDVGALAVDETRGQAWIASRDGTARSYALDSGAHVITWHLGSAATAVAVSGDGQLVATATEDGVLCLRRRQDSALLQCVAAHEAPISALAFAPHRLASAAWDGTVIVWDVPSLAILARERLPGSVNDVAFSPDGARLALARSQAPPVRTPAVQQLEQRSGKPPADAGALVSVWDAGKRTRRDLRGHTSAVTAVAWAPGGDRVVSASWDRSVRLWDSATGAALARHDAFSALVRDIAVDPRGAWVAAGAWSDADGLQESTATALIELLYAPSFARTVQASD
jgi:dipeptidyl aminopeptidase/acylaminoacyl peptidase